MKDLTAKRSLRCAIYTRVSTDHGLEQDFNSLDAQREASEAYIKSQAHEGWRLIRHHYDDGGYSGGSMDRPALQRLLADMQARRIDVIVVYKVDRLTRSLADFAKLVELFDKHNVSFVSVTQSFNTTTSMGRLTLNVLLSFAQFEREVTGERIRDKIAASKKKPSGLDAQVDLVENPPRADRAGFERLTFRPCASGAACRPTAELIARTLPGLDGGGCRDRTDGHRSLASLQNESARRGFSARNDLTQRISKPLAGKLKALTDVSARRLRLDDPNEPGAHCQIY